MSNTVIISVPPNHNLRDVFRLANQYPDVHIILQPGHHTWTFNSDWEYDPNHGWYLNGPSEIASDEHLHTIEYHDLDGIIYATCTDVVPADWHHISHVEAGDLLVINNIDDPYNDESCWKYADNIPIGVKEYLEHVFTPEIYVPQTTHI